MDNFALEYEIWSKVFYKQTLWWNQNERVTRRTFQLRWSQSKYQSGWCIAWPYQPALTEKRTAYWYTLDL